MNVFDTHRQIVADYTQYIRSFINISDSEIASTVEASLSEGRLWPQPLLQFNPVRSNYSIGLQTVVVADGYPGSEGVGSAAQPRRRGGSPRWRSRSAPKAHLKSTDVGAV